MSTAAIASTDRLNAAQRAAVEHAQGPLLVLAGAGSGKTRVIVARLARLLGSGVAPERLLAVTFTNKAARQMRERLAQVVGAKQAAAVRLCTFHALGLHVLQSEHQAAKLAPQFAIYDTADLLSVVRDLTYLTKVADRRLDLKRVLELLQKTKREGRAEVALQWGDDYELAAYDLYPRYLEQMRAFGAIDFDDLILRSTQVLEIPAVHGRWRSRFAHVLVDEYQDTSPDQLALLQRLVPPAGNLCAVGDDDQAIYAWRGAATDTIKAFFVAYPSATRIILADNYRSTGHILEAANAVIACNAGRFGKVLKSTQGRGEPVTVVQLETCEAEAAFLAEQCHVLLGRGAAPADIAVLYRANSQAALLEQTLRSERLETRVVGGQSLFERKDIRDLFAFLATVSSSQDEVALRRIVNVPPRGLGPASIDKLSALAEARGVTLHEALQLAAHGEATALGAAAKAGARALSDAIAAARSALRQAEVAQLAEVARTMVHALGLQAAIERADDSQTVRARRLANLEGALFALQRYAERQQQSAQAGDSALLALRQFLRGQALRPEQEDDALPSGAVHLMTVHAAKGLEFPYVFVVGLEEDLLPHRRALEDWQAGAQESIAEERRLCYVAMTRAKRALWLCHARTRRKHGRLVERTPSRFLQELPETVVRRQGEAPSAPNPQAAEAARAAFFRQMRQQLGMEPSPKDGKQA